MVFKESLGYNFISRFYFLSVAPRHFLFKPVKNKGEAMTHNERDRNVPDETRDAVEPAKKENAHEGAEGATASHLERKDVQDALNALKSYGWGANFALLAPLERLVSAAHQNKELRSRAEARFAGAIAAECPPAAKDYLSKKLALIGSAASVPVLAKLLADPRHVEIARYALERIPAPEAARALHNALGKVKGRARVGIVNSLGVRRWKESIPQLAEAVSGGETGLAEAALAALGEIGTPDAASALSRFADEAPKTRLVPLYKGMLRCAEQLRAGGFVKNSLALYKRLAACELPPYLRKSVLQGIAETEAPR